MRCAVGFQQGDVAPHDEDTWWSSKGTNTLAPNGKHAAHTYTEQRTSMYGATRTPFFPYKYVHLSFILSAPTPSISLYKIRFSWVFSGF